MFPLSGWRENKKAEEVCGVEARSLRRAKKVLDPAGSIFTAMFVSMSFTLFLLLSLLGFVLI